MRNNYIDSNLTIKMVANTLIWMFFGTVCITGIVLICTVIFAVFDSEDGAFEFWIFSILLTVGSAYPAIRSIKKIRYMGFVRNVCSALEEESRPLIKLEDFRAKVKEKYKATNNNTYNFYLNGNMVDYVSGAIKYNYLRNCTLEIHDGEVYIAMAKKVVKDKCPYCGAPIAGVYSEKYECMYCGMLINDVLIKG